MRRESFEKSPVEELTRLYRRVNKLIEYHKIKQKTLAQTEQQLETLDQQIATVWQYDGQ